MQSETYGQIIESPIPPNMLNNDGLYVITIGLRNNSRNYTSLLESKNKYFTKSDKKPFDLWKRIIIYGNQLADNIDSSGFNGSVVESLRSKGAIYPPSRAYQNIRKKLNNPNFRGSINYMSSGLLKIPDAVFEGPEKFITINMNNNLIYEIPDNIDQLKQLRSIQLKNNFISKISESILNSQLQYIDLENNILRSIPQSLYNRYNTDSANIVSKNLY